MNKRTLAVLAGTILLQTAAFAADSTETQSKDSPSVECQKSKCEKAQCKAAKKNKVSKAKDGAHKSVASAEAQVGAY